MMKGIIKYLFSPVIFPKKFYNYDFQDKKVKHVFYYICSVYLFVVILSIILGAFTKKELPSISEHAIILLKYIIIWISISIIAPLPISIFLRIHLPENLKETFERDKWLGMKWANKQYLNIFKVIGYSMSPIIIFTYIGMVFSKHLFYLSWLWMVLGIIGISEVLKINKVEAFVSLFFAYFIASLLFFEPLIQLM